MLKSTKKICIDLDGTICDTYAEWPLPDYMKMRPMEGVARAIDKLRDKGYHIVIYTARNMETQNNNLGAITAKQAPIIEKWCHMYGIHYDELWFGKPLADFYIDDKGITFDGNWEETIEELDRRSNEHYG